MYPIYAIVEPGGHLTVALAVVDGPIEHARWLDRMNVSKAVEGVGVGVKEAEGVPLAPEDFVEENVL